MSTQVSFCLKVVSLLTGKMGLATFCKQLGVAFLIGLWDVVQLKNNVVGFSGCQERRNYSFQKRRDP